jgi:hypothetical protein
MASLTASPHYYRELEIAKLPYGGGHVKTTAEQSP